MAYDPKDTGTPIPTSVLEASNKSTRAAQPATNTDVGFKPAQSTTSTDPGFKPTPSTSGSYVGNINNADTGLYKPTKGNPQGASFKTDLAGGGAQQALPTESRHRSGLRRVMGLLAGEDSSSAPTLQAGANEQMSTAAAPSTSRLDATTGVVKAAVPSLLAAAKNTWGNVRNWANENPTQPAPSIDTFSGLTSTQPTVGKGQVLADNTPEGQAKIRSAVEKYNQVPGMPGAAGANTQLAITPSSFESLGAPALVPSTSQQVQSAKSEAPKADGSQQPAIDAMTPQQAMQAGGLTGRPSDALRPIIHQAMLANPKSQDAINAYDQFNKIADHLDKQYTPVDPKTGQRYEVSGDMRWKDGTPVQQGLGSSQDLGPEVAALDRASGFNQPGGAPVERQVNPKYANGIGASMYNFGPNADTTANTAGRLSPNQLPSDYYLDQARGPAKALYSDVGSSGQHIPGQIVKYDEQGNRAPSLVERSGRSPDQIAEMKQQSDYAKSPEGMQQAHMKQLQDDYKHASFMSGNDTREGLMWTARAHNLQEQMADENKTMAQERAAKYGTDAGLIADAGKQVASEARYNKELQAKQAEQMAKLPEETRKSVMETAKFVDSLANDPKDPGLGLRAATAIYNSTGVPVSDHNNPQMMALHAKQFLNQERAVKAWNDQWHLPGTQSINTGVYNPQLASKLTGDPSQDAKVVDDFRNSYLAGGGR